MYLLADNPVETGLGGISDTIMDNPQTAAIVGGVVVGTVVLILIGGF